MNGKRISLVLGVIFLCCALMNTSLMFSNLAHSHAAGTTPRFISKPRAFSPTQPAHSMDGVQGNIYFGTTFGSIYALNATTGAQLWQYTDSAAIGCDPNGEHSGISILRVASRVVYINPCDTDTACSSHLVALRVIDGSQLWCSSFPIPPGWIGSFQILAVSGGIIYLLPNIYCGTPPSCNQILYALNAQDGSLLWSSSPPSSWFSAGFSNFQLVQGVIYVNIGGEMWSPAGPPVGVEQTCALNASDGSQRWCDSNDYALTSNGGEMYATNTGLTSLIALRATDGIQIWSSTVSGYGHIIVFPQVIYYITDASICAFNIIDGSQRWCTPHSVSIYLNLQIKGGLIYTENYPPNGSSNPVIQVFSTSTGTPLWTKQNTNLIAVSQGILYVWTGTNRAEELNAKDGTLLWSHYTNQNGFAYFAPVDNLIYVNTPHGILALNASNGTLLWSHFSSINVSLSYQSSSNGIAYIFSHDTSKGSYKLLALNTSNGTLLWSYSIVCVGTCYI